MHVAVGQFPFAEIRERLQLLDGSGIEHTYQVAEGSTLAAGVHGVQATGASGNSRQLEAMI